MRRKLLIISSLLAACSLALPVNAAVITFNGTAGEGVCITAAVGTGSYSEAGFTLSFTAGQAFFCDNDDPSFPGLSTFDDDVLEFNNNDTTFELTSDDGSLFDLVSVVTGSLGRNAFDDGDFIFTGFFGAGGTISQTVAALAAPAMTTFAGFTGMSKVVVTSSDGLFPVMDDLTLAVRIPEPATLVLFGIGLAGLGFVRRRTQA